MAYSRSPDRSRHSSRRERSESPRRSSRREKSKSPRRFSRRKRSQSPHRSSRRKRSQSPASSRRKRSHSPHNSSSKRHQRSSSPRRSKRSYSSDSSRDEKRRKRKEHKKHKKSKKKSKLLSIGENYGKYGIIHEADIFTKESEFQAWLIEIKVANVETLSNNKRKEMFIEFMEDYNTATLPHKKFYNIEKWEKQQEAIRMGENYTDDRFDFAKDEERLRMQHKQAAKIAASRQPTLQLSEEQIMELTRVNRERVEADRMRKMGLKPKEGMGVRYEEVTDL